MIQLILLLLLTIGIEGNSNHDQHLDVVCKDINIQEDFSGDFKDYENCTVVEGSVRIILSDDCDPDFYRSIRFPKLKEIIGYLFVYRIFMLTSLGEVFPSLVVIRGNILFHDYALIVYQMMDLQVLGLGNLTNILKGGVMIQKNPKLCYIDTVDWEEITGSADVKYHFVENRLNVHCPHNCLKNCPLIKKGRSEQRFCWSSSQCQKKCRQKCEDQTCSYQGSCCHSECLGGCTGNFSVDCISCKNVVYGGRCMKKCPFSTYLYMSWRCITEDECRKIQNKYGNDSSQIYWKPFEGNCIPECPEGYAEQELDKHSCKKCRGLCPKTCPETVVDSVESARKLRGCTYINGSLTIQIKGYNVVKELEENLGAIKEIRNYLKIARCYSIVSLNFLKNLTVIHGDKVTSRGYGFIVLDNVNLEDLWDWKNRREKLRIKNGTLSFHFNPKLCLVKIEEMKKHTDAPGWSNISLVSNGHRIACQIKMINISLQRSSSEIAVIAVTDYRLVLSDPRSLLSYIAYYRKAPFQNVTIYGGRDACGRDSWKTVDIEEENDEGNKAEPNSKQHVPGFLKEDNINFILTNLKPYTQYAVYVRTLTVASGLEAAYSPIMYFTTKPDTPSPPTDLKAQVKSDGSVEVKWNPSKRPNGIVTRYKVYVVKEYDPVEFISQRNYCEESLILSDVKKQLEEFGATTTTPIIPTVNTSIVKKMPIEKECCNCTELSIIGEEEAEHRMQFEDYLQNTAFIKIKNRRFFVRRQATTNSSFTSYRSNNSSEMVDSTESFNSSILVDPSVPVNLSTLMNTNVPLNSNVQVDSSMVMNSSAVANLSVPVNSSEPVPPNRTLYFSLRGETVLITPILHHFTEYTFKVRACQDKSAGAEVPCSAEAITTIRTARNNYADDINCTSIKIEVGNATSGIVYVKWEEPSDPNGLLVSHHIEYKNMDSKNDKAIPICITHQKFQAYGGYQLSELSAGNYSLRIRATSLAGNGNWTSPVYFYIPESKSVLTKEHVVIIIVCCLGFMAVCVFIGGWFIYKRKTSIPEGILYTSVNPEYISAALVYEPDEWEVDREKISLLRELGQGSFGMVYEGEARDIIPGKPVTKCAIKTVNESASAREKIEFLQEASVMKAFNCCHVVKLLGVVSKGQPVLVVMELMACGDLKTYLRSHRPEENPDSQPPTLKQILQMALQIADGMAYLAAKKFVHRDLAARNCMVAEDLTVKIGDFGMTRDIYETDYYRKGGKGLLPVRWMAPESLQDGIFTSQSDVWSYGVVIWEMTTLASQPYQGLSNEQVLKYVMHGGIMEKPENCPEILFGLMMRCWNYSPPKRPTFINIIEELIQHVLTPQFQKESFYFSYSEALLPESPSNENLLMNRFDTEMNLQYFPGAIVQENKQNEEAGPSEGLEGHNRNSSEMLQEQVNTSDGSKGSKISDASNGHIYFRTNRTTEC